MERSILNNIKTYCKGKRIIVVGNSSAILKADNGRFIDEHDIVIRMNYGLPIKNSYLEKVGCKTHIYMAGISRSRIAEHIIAKQQLKFVLRLTPWGEHIRGNNIYYNTLDEYNILKKEFGEFKPSSGSLVINFFKSHIDYKELNIIGFDSFKTSSAFKKNEFKSYIYKDHDIDKESKYILKCLDEKTKLIKL